MKRLHLAYALACLLGAGAPAYAQTAAGVADPQAAVPTTDYASPLPREAPAAPAGRPDQAWRAANATVGGRNAMSLTMPGMGAMGGMGGHEMHGATPDAPTAAQAPATGHAHHAGMQMGDAAAAGPQCGAGSGMQCMAGGHGAHTGMAMGAATAGQQCTPGGVGKGCCGDKGCCCAGKAAAAGHAEHTGHAGMNMDHGCCDHKEAK